MNFHFINQYRYRFALIACICFFNIAAFAQPTQEEIGAYYKQALDAQNAGDYPKAIALYETVLKEGMTSSELHNNIGLAYHKTGKLGKAILHFERALRENRSNGDALNNLQVAEQAIQEQIAPVQEMFIVRGWRSLRGVFTAGGWAVVSLLLIWLGAAVWMLNRKAGKVISNGRLAIPYILAGLVFFTFVFGFQQLSTENDSRTAVIVRPKAGLRSQPDLGSPEAITLYEGTEVHIVEQGEMWWQVELSNGTLGWVLAGVVEKI